MYVLKRPAIAIPPQPKLEKHHTMNANHPLTSGISRLVRCLGICALMLSAPIAHAIVLPNPNVVHQAALDGYPIYVATTAAGGSDPLFTSFDLNGDSSDDAIYIGYSDPFLPGNNAVIGYNNIDAAGDNGVFMVTPGYTDNVFLYSFAEGEMIDSSTWRETDLGGRGFGTGISVLANSPLSFNAYDPFNGPDYIGFELRQNGESFFGWAKTLIVQSGSEFTLVISDYAWNSEAGEGILAGQVPEPATYALSLGLLITVAAGVRRARKLRA